MSQNDLTIDCAQTGTAYTSALNDALGSLNAMHSGATAPTLNVADGMLWLDTSGSDHLIKIRTAAAWHTLFDFNGSLYQPNIPGITDTATSSVLSIANTGISLGDSDSITFGAGSDLTIQHNGLNSVIKDTGTGSLLIQSSTGLALQDADGNNFAVFTDEGTGGKVELYKGNAVKLVTTSTGASITGSLIVSERFEADTNSLAPSGAHAYFYKKTGAGASVSGSVFSVDTGTTGARVEALRINTSGEVGIGTIDPKANLDISDTNPTLRITDETDSSVWVDNQVLGTLEFYSEDTSGNAPYDTAFISSYNDTSGGSTPSGALVFGTATLNAAGGAVEKMRLSSNGFLGIGGEPARHLHVSAGTEDVAARFESSDANVTVEFKDTTGTATVVCADDFIFQSSGVDTMHIDASGNLGVGVSPELLWDSTHSVIRLGDQGLIANDANEGIAVGANYKTTDVSGTTTDRFIETDFAARHTMYNGLHKMSYSSASGSAGSVVTWVDGLTMDTSGNVAVVGTFDAAAITGDSLNVTGAINGTAITGTSLAAGAGTITGASLTTTGNISTSGSGTIDATKLSGNLPALNGSSLTGIDAFPSGTKMVFFQSSAPTGWTQDTSQNNKVLRVVSSSGGGTGGSWATSSGPTHSLSAGSHTLTISQMPSHAHGLYGVENDGGGAGAGERTTRGESLMSSTNLVESVGGGNSHSHSLTGSINAPQYIDVIIATKS